MPVSAASKSAANAAGDLTAETASLFLRGDGLELRTAHPAMAMPAGARVIGADRTSLEELTTIPDGSVDFIIANRLLEHCEDPVAAITTHLAKLRAGGILFYTVAGDPAKAWGLNDFVGLLLDVQNELGGFELEAVRRDGAENIAVLRRDGPRDRVAPVATTPSPSAIPAGTVATAIALSALRARLDDDHTHCEWSIDPDGAAGRCLVMPSGRRLTIPLRLPAAATLTGRVRLMPHDWRDGGGAVGARVLAIGSGGERELWAGTVRSAQALGELEGLELRCEVPAETDALVLALAPHVPGDRAVARALWVEPTLEVALAGAGPPVPTGAPGLAANIPVAGRPLFSVLTPVHDPPPAILDDAVRSVVGQTFTDWELCLVDDGSRDPAIVEALQAYAESDPRIRLVRREVGGGIADATNAAAELARGEYVALLDHDDWLSPDALAAVAARIAAEPDLDMLYTDEDIVLDDVPVWVHLKPGWSPDTLRTNGYTCHLGVYRRSLLREIGGFRSEFNGSQDVDMILRLTERTDRIAHVPGVHYHWRIHPDSTAGGDAKPYAYVAARNAIAGHLGRVGIDAEVGFGPPGLYRVAHHVAPSTRVALVLGIEDPSGIFDALSSFRAPEDLAWELLFAGSEAVLGAAISAARRAGIADGRIRTTFCDRTHRHAALARAAAEVAAEVDHLVLLQTPAAGISHGWLTRLVGYAAQPGVGAAGPIALGANGRIQEGGVAVADGHLLPLLHGDDSSMDRHFGYGTSVYDVTAVSGVLATSAATYARLGGLRPEFAELSLVDYCLRAGDAGLRTVIVPDARVQITGRDETVNDLDQMASLLRDHRDRVRSDRFYNALWRTDRGDFQPA